MKTSLTRYGAALSSALLLLLAACGGDGDSAAPPVAAATTTNVATTVIDGAIQNAVVCLDKNANGKCDTDETQGKTDATGAVTLAVPNADVGKYPVIAVVGTDAVDADHGPVTVPYTLSTPADQTGIVSPLTTLVQQTVSSSGSSTADAAKTIQDATGITVSLFQDFTKATAPTDGSVSAATIARMLVVTTQNQSTAVAATVGTPAADGTTITQAQVDTAVQKKLLELLPQLVAALSDPAIAAATTPAAKEAALTAAATSLVTNSGLTAASIPTVVAINTQASAPAPAAAAPAASLSIRDLNFGSTSNYYYRAYVGTLAENTPDSSGNTRNSERRIRAVSGSVAKWGTGSDPWRNADLHWNGSAWVGCPPNAESTSGPRDALNGNAYNTCDNLEVGKVQRSSFDIGGKTMAEIYAQVRTAGYTNLTIADATTALGSASFPTGSTLSYVSATSATTAIGYYPAGVNSPVGTSNLVTQYSAAVAAGGDATTQAAGVACNSTETAGSGGNSTSFETMIAAKTGTPCVFATGTITSNGVTYTSDTPNAWWGNSTVSLGKLGSAALSTGTTGYYTGNTPLRIAFTGGNAVTYYACKERIVNGSVRNCSAIGTGTYAISTLADARVMTFTNPPAQAATLGYNRVFVERGGVIYFGYQNKLGTFNSARLNIVAANALLSQLGLTPEDPATPLALTRSSYSGTWDISAAATPPNPSIGTTLFVNADGSTSCLDKTNNAPFACQLTLDPATGAFTYSDSGGNATGTMTFLTGTGTGLSDTTNLLLGRR